MKYGSIRKNDYNMIVRDLGKFSSPLFMCYTHLLLANQEWKDTGITGILVVFVCRKLKTSGLRIYDEFGKMVFEFELYSEVMNYVKYGKQYCMIPFFNKSFCFLFEESSITSSFATHLSMVCSQYPIPSKEDKRKRGKDFQEISGVQNFQMIEHSGHQVENVKGVQVYDMLYKDATCVSIKKMNPSPSKLNIPVSKNVLRPLAPPKSATQLPPSLKNGSSVGILPSSERFSALKEHLHVIDTDSASSESTTENRISMSIITENAKREGELEGEMKVVMQKKRENHNPSQDKAALQDSLTFIPDEENEGIIEPPREYIDCNTRGKKYMQAIEKDRERSVQEIAEYMKKKDLWSDTIIQKNQEKVMDKSIFIIDDADENIKQINDEAEDFPVRDSLMTVLNENDMPVTHPATHSDDLFGVPDVIDYSNRSKESIMIMNDINGLLASSSLSIHSESSSASNPPPLPKSGPRFRRSHDSVPPPIPELPHQSHF